jgi:hypothetical protein
MRKFQVENRSLGVVVLHGTIAEDGALTIDDVGSSFDPRSLPGILDSIRRDLAEGFNGGKLPQGGFDWFELPE